MPALQIQFCRRPRIDRRIFSPTGQRPADAGMWSSVELERWSDGRKNMSDYHRTAAELDLWLLREIIMIMCTRPRLGVI